MKLEFRYSCGWRCMSDIAPMNKHPTRVILLPSTQVSLIHMHSYSLCWAVHPKAKAHTYHRPWAQDISNSMPYKHLHEKEKKKRKKEKGKILSSSSITPLHRHSAPPQNQLFPHTHTAGPTKPLAPRKASPEAPGSLKPDP